MTQMFHFKWIYFIVFSSNNNLLRHLYDLIQIESYNMSLKPNRTKPNQTKTRVSAGEIVKLGIEPALAQFQNR